MAGVATEEAAATVDDPLDSGPVYGADDNVAVDCPIPKGTVLVLAAGVTEDKLVVYEELG